jgi:aminoglycoside/choline kinase family phosphotransferase
MSDTESTIINLYENFTGSSPSKVIPLPASGSDRKYYRLISDGKSFIAAYNEEIKENIAFIEFANHFRNKELPVPKVINVSKDLKAYLQEDLGDETLFSILTKEGLSENVREYYHKVVKILPLIQSKGIEDLDLSKCYPRREFDKQSMMWDLNYFKYYFAKLSGLQFDEQLLEDDFETLTTFLLEADSQYFMYRDFQSRNILVKDNEPWFIDFQGGRLGPLQYDIASLLYDAKANLPEWFREELLDDYLTFLISINDRVSKDRFLKYFDGFVLMRILQALGAYGFRGYFQKKQHFLQSIPYAMENLQVLLSKSSFRLHIPELVKILKQAIEKNPAIKKDSTTLNVRVLSFSYKQGIPQDDSGHGGGFVFDCRALPNPGRLEQYKNQSGLDAPVIEYLEAFNEPDEFLQGVYKLADMSVSNYLERGFTNLMFSFGCTGGRHRSVYCAEKLAEHLNRKFKLNIRPEHTQAGYWQSE